MIRFSKSNWARFDTHGKVTTIRTKPLKIGVHAAMGGSRYKPERLGDVEVVEKMDDSSPVFFDQTGTCTECSWKPSDNPKWKNKGEPSTICPLCCELKQTRKLIRALSERDARRDGFANRDELIMELARLNKDLTPDSTVWINPVRKIK